LVEARIDSVCGLLGSVVASHNLVTHTAYMGELKKKDKNKAIAFQAARLRLRSEKVDAAWRETISVNLGCRQVPGDGG
jgi:hypothetical protein